MAKEKHLKRKKVKVDDAPISKVPLGVLDRAKILIFRLRAPLLLDSTLRGLSFN